MHPLHVSGTDLNGDINAQEFILSQFLGRHVFITLGQVVNVKEGVIDIRPMVMRSPAMVHPSRMGWSTTSRSGVCKGATAR